MATTSEFSESAAAVQAQAEPAMAVAVESGGGTRVTGTTGDDKLGGTDGNDAMFGGGGHDYLFGGAGDDTLSGGTGEDTLYGGEGSDTFRIEAGGKGDTIADFSVKKGDRIELSVPGLTSFDQLEGRMGAFEDGTIIKMDDGSTVIIRGLPPDALTKETVTFAPPANEIVGTKDDDKLEGTDSDDVIHGGEGRDDLFGGAGNDTLSGDGCDDTLYGGEGRDTFRVEAGGGVDTVADFSAAEGDRIELSIPGLSSFDQLEGRMGWYGEGTVIKLDDGSAVFIKGVKPDELTRENVVFDPPICFHAGTLILTPVGLRRVQDLVPGDLVLTRDHDAQPLLWSQRSLHRAPAPDVTWQPILIATGALGQGLPHRPLRLSPQHRVLVTNPVTGTEVLVAARKLTGRPGIRVQLGVRRADYVHLLFARHEILWAEGAPAESLLVAPGSIRRLPVDLALRLAGMQPARPILRYDPAALHRPPRITQTACGTEVAMC